MIMYCYEEEYNEDCGLADILVYKNFADIPNEVFKKCFVINGWKILWKYAENGIIYICEYKARPVMEILIYEAENAISDEVRRLYRRVYREELIEILDKYR